MEYFLKVTNFFLKICTFNSKRLNYLKNSHTFFAHIFNLIRFVSWRIVTVVDTPFETT